MLKHAFEDITSESLLSINFKKKDDTLVLKVIDNGKGFNGEIKETSFGIKLMNTLAKKLRATLNYKSSENNGTEVVLNIKKFEIL